MFGLSGMQEAKDEDQKLHQNIVVGLVFYFISQSPHISASLKQLLVGCDANDIRTFQNGPVNARHGHKRRFQDVGPVKADTTGPWLLRYLSRGFRCCSLEELGKDGCRDRQGGRTPATTLQSASEAKQRHVESGEPNRDKGTVDTAVADQRVIGGPCLVFD